MKTSEIIGWRSLLGDGIARGPPFFVEA